jgi:hypothetical protein
VETATDHHSHLGAENFKQLQMLKFSWHKTLANSAQANSGIVEEVLLDEYKDFLLVDQDHFVVVCTIQVIFIYIAKYLCFTQPVLV